MKSYLIQNIYEKKIVSKKIKDYIINEKKHKELENTKLRIDNYSDN